MKSSKSFLGALARQNFAAPTRPKNDCFFFVASKAKAFAVLPIFGGTSKDKIDDQYKFILQKMKVSYDHYETLLHNFATNSVRQVLAKFLHLSLKELWT